MAPIRLKKVLVSCYLDREQLDRLKELSHRKGEPMTYYLREGVALVLDKYAKQTTSRKPKP
jgi:predicted DNA-binding protein